MARKIFGHTLWWWLFSFVLMLALGLGWLQWLPWRLAIGLLIIASLGLTLLHLSFKG